MVDSVRTQRDAPVRGGISGVPWGLAGTNTRGGGATQQPVAAGACARDGRLRRRALDDQLRAHSAGCAGPRRHLARDG